MAATPYNASFFDQQVAGSLTSASFVLPLLFQYHKPRSVVDVGCGVGPWLKCSLALGVEDVLGIDGDYVDRSRLLIDPDRFRALDLNERIEVDRRFDLAISVEVAEHLSFFRSETFVADLVKLSDVILFSAALPYQGGTEHINEQWLEFWAILFRRHGYVACDFLRTPLWANERVEFWYSQNLLVFCPKSLASKIFPKESIAADRPLSFLHPMTFLANVARYRPYSAEARDLEFLDYTHLLQAYVAGETTLPLLRTLAANGSASESRVPLFPNARTEIVDARAELRRRDRKIESLSAEVAARETEAKRLLTELTAQTESADRLSADVNRATAEGQALRRELEASNQQINCLSVERQELRQELEASKQEVRHLDSALADHKEEINRLLNKLASEERERQALRDLDDRQKGALETELRQSRTKIDQHAADLRSKEDQIRLLSSDLAETNHALNATRASWSWRITAPVRFVADILLEISRLPRTAGQRLSQLLAYSQYVWRGSRLEASGLFDSRYYLEQNPDVGKSRSKSNPLLHFFLFGAAERRNPHPLFDVKYYLEQNPDVAKSRINPLLHYFCWGADEGRDPHPHFDSSFYLNRYPDVQAGHWNPLVHYMGPGTTEGLDPNPWFDTSEYLEQNPRVALKGLNPLLHHLASRDLRRLEAPEVVEVNPGETELRISLRAEFEESGRPLPDSEYDSYPLVSVIVPCFNHGHYLEDAILSSLLACSYPIEIIVVDDGSTDSHSVAVVDELAAKYKFKLVRQANTGLAGARNTGLRLARGKFIQFLDADDLLARDKIDIQVDEFYSDATIDVCLCEYDACNAEGGGRCVMQPSTIAGFSLSREDFLLRWERGFSVPIHCALFRSELLTQMQFQSVTIAGKEDWIFWIELLSESRKFHFNPVPLATYRIHGSNSTANHEAMGLDFLRAAMYVIESGLNSDNFLQASIEHFRTAYLGSIKHDAIVWSRTHSVD